jgi:hypothetical protein
MRPPSNTTKSTEGADIEANGHWRTASVARPPARLSLPSQQRTNEGKPLDADVSVCRSRDQRPLSVSHPATLPSFPSFGVMENKHFISMKTPESCLASLAGGREEPKPLSITQTPSPSQMCQHHQVYITMCMCVSIFTNIFPKDLATQLAMPLDPNNDAKLDHSSGTR